MFTKKLSGRPSESTTSRPLENRGLLDRLAQPVGLRKGSANQSTKQALLLLQNFEESGRGWLWSTDAEGCISFLSEPVCELLGRPLAELIGSSFTDLFRKIGSTANCERTLPFLLTKQSRFDDLPLQAASANGKEIWWAVSGSPVFETNQKFAGFRGSGIDVTERRRHSKDTSRQATYDSLTGLLNRFQMSKLLETTLLSFKHQKRVCSIMLVDLDRFKQVNDSLGHPAGDILLKQVADRLVRVVGDRDKISRLGGDEFQIILQDVDDRGILGEMADRIIHSLSQPYMVDGSRCVIGASVGIVVSPFDGQSREELVRNADLALYAAKGNGRGRFRFYSYELLRAAEERRGLEDDLRDALGKNEITLVD